MTKAAAYIILTMSCAVASYLFEVVTTIPAEVDLK